MATVAGDGAFSCFEGVDRTLTVLAGDGLELTVAGRVHRLTVGSAPLTFPGDAPSDASLLGGAVTDLNVMTRRGVFEHGVEAVAAGPIGGPDGEGAICVVVALADIALADTAHAKAGPERARLSIGDALFLDHGETVVAAAASPSVSPGAGAERSGTARGALALRITIRPAAGPDPKHATRD